MLYAISCYIGLCYNEAKLFVFYLYLNTCHSIAAQSFAYNLEYREYAMKEFSMNSTSPYETNQFSTKGFSCLFSHHSLIHWFFPEEINVISQHIGQKANEYLNSAKQITSNWNVNHISMLNTSWDITQHQPIVKRVNGVHEWAHRQYQLLSAPYHCCLYKYRGQDEKQPPQSCWPVSICT